MVASAGETNRDLAATQFTKTASHTILQSIEQYNFKLYHFLQCFVMFYSFKLYFITL